MIKIDKIIILVLIIVLTIFTSITTYSQNYLDLSTFYDVNGGYWYHGQDNSSVKQVLDKNESVFYILDQEIINKTITGIIKVDSTTYQNDQFGLVFGFQDINDTFVWSWDAGGVHGTEGHVFYYKDRAINNLEIPGDILYDKREAGLAWQKEVEYNFKAVYLENSFKLFINDNLIIDYKGELSPGKFGLFCYTQDMVNFSNIEIKDASDKIKPLIEDLNNPIDISGGIVTKNSINDNLTQSTYQITNTSKYDLEELYLLVELDKNLSLIEDSVFVSKQNIRIDYFKEKNILKLDNLNLKAKESIQLSFYLQKLSSYNKNNYYSMLSVYSNKENVLLSKQITTKHKSSEMNIDLSSIIIGKVEIINNEKQSEKINYTTFRIISSDGRLIKIDQDGRFHLTYNNFNNYFDQKILTLKLIVKNKKYNFAGDKLKMIKIYPNQIINKDFNLYIGGVSNE